jgi:hypothetical protein
MAAVRTQLNSHRDDCVRAAASLEVAPTRTRPPTRSGILHVY